MPTFKSISIHPQTTCPATPLCSPPRALPSAHPPHHSSSFSSPFKSRALPLYFVPIDTDLLTMDARVQSRALVVHDDTSLLPHVAAGLARLAREMRVSWSPVVCAGQAATDVHTLMREMDKAQSRKGGDDSEGYAGAQRTCRLVLFDRRVDLVRQLRLCLHPVGLINSPNVIRFSFLTQQPQPQPQPHTRNHNHICCSDAPLAGHSAVLTAHVRRDAVRDNGGCVWSMRCTTTRQ